MFRCQITNKNSKPNEKPIRLVTETRKVEYFKKVRDEENDLVFALDKSGNKIKQGEGFEIVKEKLVLASVAKELKNGK